MQTVAIFGAGGLGQLVLDILLQRGDVCVAGVLDSDESKHGGTMDGLPILGGFECIDRLRWDGVTGMVVAIGHNAARVRVAEHLQRQKIELIAAIHPLAHIAPSATIGPHAIIGPRASICVHARVHAHVVISAGAIIEHDCVLETGVFVHPAGRLAGGVHVEREAVVGIGAAVIPGRRIGARARIEPGAVVIRDVPPGGRCGGVPGELVTADARR
jgi:sugar O-acyltransferase (sialic acid O-acetyltransferase NeuD family)